MVTVIQTETRADIETDTDMGTVIESKKRTEIKKDISTVIQTEKRLEIKTKEKVFGVDELQHCSKKGVID